MPMMMDEDMDMEDLFGDGGGLAMPSQPPSKEIYQRVDDMRGGGSCQSIAWSKWGSIAAIAPNGTDLELRNLRCAPGNGSWALSEATITSSSSPTPEGGPLRHLSWSPTGSELAMVDSVGRISILGIFSTVNKSSLQRPSQLDPVDDLHRVVGSLWLNIAPYGGANRPKILNGPAVKEGSTFKYEASTAPTLGPCHPNPSKSAFVCITTNGLVRVIWPQINNKWYESHTELESIVSSEDLITHAAICPDKSGTLLIAFATTSKQLRIVRAVIDWGLPKTNEKDARIQAPLNPTIRIRHQAVTSWMNDGVVDTLNASSFEGQMTQLSHLEFLPISTDTQGRFTPPTIVTFRSYLPISSAHYNQDVYTTVDRWELREKAQAIHPAFDQLSSRRSSVGSQPGAVPYLKRLDSFTVNKIFLTVQQINYGKVIFFAYSDGSIEYRDRSTMQETFNDGDLNRVWHLSQIGFTYIDEEPCLQVALSPSWCSLVHLSNDGKVKWRRLDYPLGDIGQSMDDSQYAAVVAALALSCSTAVMRTVNYDDVLATAHKHISNNLGYDWIMDLSRILKVNVDYSEDTHNDALIRNTTVQLALCIQNSVGFRGEFQPRSFAGKLAWIILQLRSIVVLVTVASNVKRAEGTNSEPMSPLDDPEIVNALTGSVRWVLDLLAWITDTLLTLPDTLPPNLSLTDPDKLSLPDLLKHLHSTNTISLHLLLSSTARGFLTAICRLLAHLDYIARKAMQRSTMSSTPSTNPAQTPPQSAALSPALKAAYTQIATLTSSTIIRFKTIENLLLSLGSRVKTAYAAANTTSNNPTTQRGGQDPVRNGLEQKMLFGGAFPDSFKSVLIELYRKEGLLEGVRNEIDPAKLYFADFDVLEVDEDPASIRARKSKNRTMDCFRKNWLVNPPRQSGAQLARSDASSAAAMSSTGKKWRRCARCAAVMEDVVTTRAVLQWLVMQQRRCYCSGYWYTLPVGESAA